LLIGSGVKEYLISYEKFSAIPAVRKKLVKAAIHENPTAA
jgi:hypothetical protein